MIKTKEQKNHSTCQFFSNTRVHYKQKKNLKIKVAAPSNGDGNGEKWNWKRLFLYLFVSFLKPMLFILIKI